jgi:hypothetical protein
MSSNGPKHNVQEDSGSRKTYAQVPEARASKTPAGFNDMKQSLIGLFIAVLWIASFVILVKEQGCPDFLCPRLDRNLGLDFCVREL